MGYIIREIAEGLLWEVGYWHPASTGHSSPHVKWIWTPIISCSTKKEAWASFVELHSGEFYGGSKVQRWLDT